MLIVLSLCDFCSLHNLVRKALQSYTAESFIINFIAFSLATLTMRTWNILTVNSMLVIISIHVQVGSKCRVFAETQGAIDT